MALAAGYTLRCAVPLQLRDERVGALTVFWSFDEALGETALMTAQAITGGATISLLQERTLRESRLLADQLQRALDSRVLIEQAKGFSAERSASSVDQAFDAIRRDRRAPNRKLTETARDIVKGRLDITGAR